MALSEVGYRILVIGLYGSTDEASLETAFAPFGEMIECKIMRDRETGLSRLFGIVTYSSEDSMRHAIQSMNEGLVDGATVTVLEAKAPSHRSGRNGNERE
ncbi:glycine-rich RNA-binding protein GRP1A-like [Hordeum vulgare]|nr:glycine-rich RNA-binding protein GRP1A-like [Hordeum vulgare]